MPTGKELEQHRMTAHDAAGYESDLIQQADWSMYDDGYGNNVNHGDLSVQRMIERGARFPWMTTEGGEGEYGQAQPAKAYDTEPFQSQAQRRFMYAKHPEIAARWQKHTPKGAHLPEHKAHKR